MQAIDNRIVFTYDGGDPPNARAGRALDLHQAAVERVRADALRLRKHVAFFLDDRDSLAAMPLDRWAKERAPAVVAALPDLAASDKPYDLAVFGGSLERQPSPPAPPTARPRLLARDSFEPIQPGRRAMAALFIRVSAWR